MAFEKLKNWWKWKKENRKRRKIAKEIGTGKRPRGRIPVNEVEGGAVVKSRLKIKGSISARVIRTDGTIEDLGVISETKEEGN